MTQSTIEQALEDARARIEEAYVDDNGTVKKADVYTYVKHLDAVYVLEDVLENYQEEFEGKLLELFSNPLFIDRILSDIMEDEYILPDWYSNTDYHDYATDTIELIEKAYKDYTEKY